MGAVGSAAVDGPYHAVHDRLCGWQLSHNFSASPAEFRSEHELVSRAGPNVSVMEVAQLRRVLSV